MKLSVALTAVVACWTISGCARGLVPPTTLAKSRAPAHQTAAMAADVGSSDQSARAEDDKFALQEPPLPAAELPIVTIEEQEFEPEGEEPADLEPQSEVVDETPPAAQEPLVAAAEPEVSAPERAEPGTVEPAVAEQEGQIEPQPVAQVAFAGQQPTPARQEVIGTPPASGPGDPAPGEGGANENRFARRIDQVPLSIKPPGGEMPQDLATEAFAEAAKTAPGRECENRPFIACAYTPWTLCFRPLYFEEINLERYGETARLVQPAVSGAHFFSRVALLPYEMTIRPPRSCVCSNGFSQIGDAPPPWYYVPVWQTDAALVQAGVIAALAVALPW